MKTKEGYSVLHIVASAERGTTEILKCLEQAGALPGETRDGWTVGFLAATAGHESMVEYIVSKPHTPPKEQAEILELCGSVLFDKNNLISSAMVMWKRAMAIRHQHDIVLKSEEILPPLKAYDYQQEAIMITDLTSLPEDRHHLEMHSLLIRERIIGERRSTAFYIRRRGLRYSSCQCYEWTMNLWLHALQMHKRIIKPGDPDIRAILLNCTNTFKDMIAHKYHPEMKAFFQWGLDDVIQSSPDSDHRCKMMAILLNFLGVWLGLDCEEMGDEWCTRTSLIQQLVQADICDAHGHSVLHLACSSTTAEGNYYKLCEFPNLDVVTSLLACGANPNKVNLSKEVPLHCLAKSARRSPSMANSIEPVLHRLVHYGAVMGCRDKLKRTPVDVLVDNNGEGDVSLVPPQTLETFWTVTHGALQLQSLAAAAVVDYGVIYEPILPLTMKRFVQLH
jgi:ankyrin repeat protein